MVQEAEAAKARGNEAFSAGRVQEAADLYREAAGLDPSNHAYLGNLSAALLKLKDYEGAVESALRAVRLAPSWAKGYVRLGTAYREAGFPSEADEAFERASELTSNSSSSTDGAPSQQERAAEAAAVLAGPAQQCSNCGAVKAGDGAKLRKCQGCLSAQYCSRACQRSHWRSHKALCRAGSRLPATRAPSTRNASPLGFGTGFRPMTIREPPAEMVLCCCWCCGMLIKKCGPYAENPARDLDGPFWTPGTYGRSVGGGGCAEPGEKAVPALRVLGAPGGRETGVTLGYNRESGDAICCFFCFQRLVLEGADPETHIARCERWLRDDAAAAAAAKADEALPKLSPPARRMAALVTLNQTPDLRDGPSSIAGRMEKKGGGTHEVPFTFRRLENLAFPHLLLSAEGCHGPTIDELMPYTLMRLYSVDPRWRQDEDYVVFSLHRLAAFGFQPAVQAVAQLPQPVSWERMEAGDLEAEEIAIRFTDAARRR